MKKLIITSAIVLAAVSSQAQIIEWADTDGIGNWTTAANWDGGQVPTTGNAANVMVRNHTTVWPTINSDIGNVNTLGVGWENGNDGVLNVVDGARLGAVELFVGMRSNGELNMSGGQITAINRLAIGWTDGQGVGTVNLTGDALLFSLNGPLSWTPGSVINISDDAIFLVTGDHTAADWITNGLIATPEAGHHIEAAFEPSSGRTFFEAIPEPGTISLFAGLGGALLFVRKRFMI